MSVRRAAVLAVMIVCLGGLALAQEEDLPLSNWSAPPYWSPAVQPRAQGEPGGGMIARAAGMQAHAEALPSSPLPFVAIQPCRIVDTRVAVDDGFHRPNFADDEARTFALPTSPDCTGLPVTAGAWSLNIQFRPISQLSFLTAYPTGTTIPGVSTMTAGPAAWAQNAAIVPAGTAGAIDIYCQYAGRVIIDINGYYGPHSVVTSLNTLTGDMTLAEGANVTITPSGQTLTIAATGGPGGELPAGSANQTLRHNGSAWEPSSALTNDGSTVGVSGNLALPATSSASSGVLTLDGQPFLHAYGPTTYPNTFVGALAGTFSLTGTGANVGVGTQALAANASGTANTAVGHQALMAEASGSYNTAVGAWALKANVSGGYNTAVGRNSLIVSTGDSNTAVGYGGLYSLNSGNQNTAVGVNAGLNLTSGSSNTFLGYMASTDAAHGALTNATAIGANALVTQSNSLVLGGLGANAVNVGIGTSAPDTTLQVVGDIKVGTTGTNGCLKNFAGTGIAGTCSSDIRLKDDIQPFESVLDRVALLRPVRFTWRAAEFPEYHFGPGENSGLIAQDVEPLFPEMVATDEHGYKTVNYSELPYLMLAAVRELKGENDALIARNAALAAENEDIRAELRRLAAAVEGLQARQARPGSEERRTTGR